MNLLSGVNVIKPWLPRSVQDLLGRLEVSSLARRLAHGAFWTSVGTFASRGLNMVAMIVLARILGKEEFGEIGIIQGSVMMFETLAGFGLGWAATKYVAEFKNTDPAKAGRIISFVNYAAIATGGVLSLLFYFAAPWLAENTMAAPHLAQPLQLSSLVLFFSTLAGTQNGTLAGFEAFKSIARINLFSGLVNFCSIIIGGLYWGVMGAVVGLLLGQVANWGMNYFNMRFEAIRRGILVGSKGCWAEKEVLWKFGLPAILGGTMFQVATWASSALLVSQSGGFAEMGFYSAANQWFSALLFLPRVLGQAAIPALSEHIALGDVGIVRKILFGSLRINSVIVLSAVALGSVCSPWIMGLYGEEFSSAWLTLVLTLIAAGITAIQAPAAQLISSSGKMWFAMVMNGSWAIIFVIFSCALINLGSSGLATARVIAYAVYTIWSFVFSLKLLRNLNTKSSFLSS